MIMKLDSVLIFKINFEEKEIVVISFFSDLVDFKRNRKTERSKSVGHLLGSYSILDD